MTEILRWPLIAGYLLSYSITPAFSQPYPLDQLIPSKPPPAYNTQPTQPTQLTPEQQLLERLRIQELKNELLRKEWEQKMFETGIEQLNNHCDSFRKNLGVCR